MCDKNRLDTAAPKLSRCDDTAAAIFHWTIQIDSIRLPQTSAEFAGLQLPAASG
jgi:hypothetical protein